MLCGLHIPSLWRQRSQSIFKKPKPGHSVLTSSFDRAVTFAWETAKVKLTLNLSTIPSRRVRREASLTSALKGSDLLHAPAILSPGIHRQRSESAQKRASEANKTRPCLQPNSGGPIRNQSPYLLSYPGWKQPTPNGPFSSNETWSRKQWLIVTSLKGFE
jgi:hypothetical protein